MTQAFNLSQFANNVDTSGKAILTSGQAVTGTLPVANGGTGQATLSSGAVVLGNGTSGVTTVSPAISGNLLYANGSAWVSQTPAFGVNIQYFTTSTTWTVPPGVNKVLAWVFGGAGAGYYSGTIPPIIKSGGYGGYAAGLLTGITGTLSITVGAGGAAAGTGSVGAAGQTSSITQGATTYISATGGAAATGSGAAIGTGTLGSGVTKIRLLCGLEGAQLTPSATSSASIDLTGNAQTIVPQTTIFVNTGLSYGRTNTVWSINYLEAPGTAYLGSSITANGNGMGGAVIIQY